MMESTVTNRGTPVSSEVPITYSTADSEHAVFYGQSHEWPSPEDAATLIVIAGDMYALDTETVPPGTPISPDAGITRLSEEASSDSTPLE
jgi:hypothetical protein